MIELNTMIGNVYNLIEINNKFNMLHQKSLEIWIEEDDARGFIRR